MAPAVIEREYFTPPETARLLGVKHDKILAWIKSGELAAVNLATRHGGRPRWRISRQALDDFLARRAAKPPPKPRRRRREPQNVIQFYR